MFQENSTQHQQKMEGSPLRYVGPDFKVQLSVHDARNEAFYSRRLLVFKTDIESDAKRKKILNIIHKALQLLVKKVPILGGRVVTLHDEKESQALSPTGQKRWKSVSKGDGITLVLNDATESVASFEALQANNFQPETLPEDKLLPIQTTFLPEPYEVAYFQLNWIKGGLILACCVAHLAADGTAHTEIIKILAGYCRNVYEFSHLGETTSSIITESDQKAAEKEANLQQEKWKSISTEPPIGLDRGLLLSSEIGRAAQAVPDDGAMISTEQAQSLAHSITNLPAHTFKAYRINRENLLRLKQDAAPATGSNLEWISTNDALVALSWRAVVANRVAAGVLPTRGEFPLAFGFPVSATTRLPSVGKDFIGNTLVNRRIDSFTLSDVLDGSPLSRLAAAVRGNVNSVTPDVIAKYTEQIEATPAVNDLKTSLIYIARTQGVLLASLYNSSPIYESDWGEAFGKHVVRLRCSSAGFAGARTLAQFVLPKLHDGSAELLLALYENGIEAMERDSLFSKYVDPIPKMK